MRSLILAIALSLGPGSQAAAQQVKPLTLQSEASQFQASPGEAGATIETSALIAVSVTDGTGRPVSNLGASVGNGTATIALPTGWSLTTIAVPGGGGDMRPTAFVNGGNGLYLIRVAQTLPSTEWVAGDYIYSIRFSSAVRSGQALKKLTIRSESTG